jgi:hypothetical protein
VHATQDVDDSSNQKVSSLNFNEVDSTTAKLKKSKVDQQQSSAAINTDTLQTTSTPTKKLNVSSRAAWMATNSSKSASSRQ